MSAPVSREPDLARPHAARVAELISITASLLQSCGEQVTRPRVGAPPSELLDTLTKQVRAVCDLVTAYKNGATAAAAAEPYGYTGRAARSRDTMVAAATPNGDPALRAVAELAASSWDDLSARGLLGLAAPSREKYILAAVAAAGGGFAARVPHRHLPKITGIRPGGEK